MVELFLTLPDVVLLLYPLLMGLRTLLPGEVEALCSSVVCLPPVLINLVGSQDDLGLQSVDDVFLGFMI